MPDAVAHDGPALESLTAAFKTKISECLEKNAAGGLKMTVTFPDATVIDQMAQALARIAGAGGKSG